MKRFMMMVCGVLLAGGIYAQVPAMPDAGTIAGAAKAGAVSEVMEDSMKKDDRVDTTANARPGGQTKRGKSSMVIFTSVGAVIVIAAAVAVRRRKDARKGA